MSLNTALAISLGVLGAVATWLFLGPLGGMLAIWAAFIAWGCYYHCGGKETGLQSTILGTAAGAVIAGITLKVAGMGVGLPETMWTAICVGLGVAAMVLLANVPMFASVTEASMANPVVVIILSMILGAVFGYVSEKVAGMLMGAGDHRAAAKV
jgi:tetrahydromethanopterin S-methyltransferase subunit C